MIYRFRCNVCNRTFDIDIPMSDYDNQKDKQICPVCYAVLKRVIEWEGIATATGDGWFGRSDGSTAI